MRLKETATGVLDTTEKAGYLGAVGSFALDAFTVLNTSSITSWFLSLGIFSSLGKRVLKDKKK